MFQLLSTPHFYKVRDRDPSSTSLLSFISDAAVFPNLSLLRDCGFDLLQILCRRVSVSNGQVLAYC